ncbi:MAG: putative addiction module antidote protein [Alphaproteobacteria bacterium]|nr:putative addiction module antidote protein [Alphaproteobacteria bacterium]
MFIKIKKIEILPDYAIKATFDHDVVKTYDFKPLFDKYPVFEPLKNETFFANAVIDCGGYGLMWTDDIDIDAGELWYNGITTLDTEQDIVNYLNAVVNETDTKLFIKALKDIAKSKGVNDLAKKMGVNRESLYKSLDGERKPKYETIDKFLRAIGMKITFCPA